MTSNLEVQDTQNFVLLVIHETARDLLPILRFQAVGGANGSIFKCDLNMGRLINRWGHVKMR